MVLKQITFGNHLGGKQREAATDRPLRFGLGSGGKGRIGRVREGDHDSKQACHLTTYLSLFIDRLPSLLSPCTATSP